MKLPKELKERGILNRIELCSVLECNKQSVRVVTEHQYDGAMILNDLKYLKKKSKKIHLCKFHFSIVKKRTKNENVNRKGFLYNDLKPKYNRY